MSNPKNKLKTVYVAMSGGVDSSVAAALLKKRGFKVAGVFFKPWQPKKGVEFCNWQEDRRDALAAATALGMPLKTWDFSREYEQKVGRYMINTYRQGLTPNPDVECNKEIKFGLFLSKALAEGVNFIATGHYVRSAKRKAKNAKGEACQLLKAKDKNKDQSYFLWKLTQEELRHCLFPVGDYTKPEVRKMAKKFGLPNHAKKDSQGVCFIGQLDMKDFLKSYLPPRAGEIKSLETGETIGQHEGAQYYTIGQRHGLNITIGDGPYFVAKKDLVKNVIYVTAKEKQLEENRLTVEKISWVGNKILPTSFSLQIRYRTPAVPAKLVSNKNQILTLKTKKPLRAVTPGQSAVFYRGEEMLGGGVIK